jgi:hypothetical protein
MNKIYRCGGKREGSGRPMLEDERLEKVTVRLPISRLDIACEKTGMTRSQLLRAAFNDFVINFK